jgi:serine phosphatase RsbU (regulator of sigma subunit)/pSer/pThr/pTyr-binding forkhead associated (FHA) protein
MNQLQILSPDGASRIIALDQDSFSLGRSRETQISFPDDTGLSRHHLTILRVDPGGPDQSDATGWAVRDEGSRNGTLVNGEKIAGTALLKAGDKISAGHLIIACRNSSGTSASDRVVVFDPSDESYSDDTDSAKTVVTDLAAIRGDSSSGSGSGVAQSLIVSALIRAGNELAGHRPLPELFRFILDLSIQTVRANRGVLLTLEGGELVVQSNQGEGFHISTAVRDRVLNSGVSVLVRDTSRDDAFRERRSIVEQNVRTLMAVPLQTRDQVIGIIYVDSPSLLREFSKDDLNLLTVMANVAAVRIEQARYAEAEQSRQLMERELQQAAEIQKGLLPAAAPLIRGLDLAGHNAPCRTVGGDYYDFFPRGDHRVGIFLGDVTGKGMPASLLMMGLQARVQVLLEEAQSPAAVMTKLNRITSANCPPNRFITLFFCILDGVTGELTFCNAGHNPPLIIRASGEYELLKGGGPVIGMLPSVEYRESSLQLDGGDILVIYSDGITEATDTAGEQFGVERLAETAVRLRDQPSSAIVSEINNALDMFTGGAPPSDDITIVVVRRIAVSEPRP